MKKRLIRSIALGFTAILCVMLFCFTEFALTDEEYDALVNRQMESIGADSLSSLGDEETKAIMEQLGINNTFSLSDASFTPENLQKIYDAIKKPAVLTPLTTVICVSCVLLLCKLSCTLTNSSGKLKDFTAINGFFPVCAVIMLLLPPLIERISRSFSAVKGLTAITAGFIPVFAAAVTGSGQPVSASLAAAGVFSVSELSVWVCNTVVMPLCSVFIAFGIAGAFGGSQWLSGATSFIKNFMTFTVGGAAALLTGMLALKSYIAAAADSLSVRAAKSLISGLVPVVGGGLSESVSALISCMGVVRASTGFFGIALIFLTFAPHLLALFGWKLCICCCAAVTKELSDSAVKVFLGAIGDLLDMLLAVFSLIMTAMIVSIAVIIKSATV